MSHSLFQILLETMQRWWMRRQTTRQLSTLSDHALRDIGLTRQDIDSAVEETLQHDLRQGAGRRRPVPADAGPSLSSSGLYR